MPIFMDIMLSLQVGYIMGIIYVFCYNHIPNIRTRQSKDKKLK